MMILLKILPLYSLYNTKIYWKDIIATVILFIIYLFWIFLNNKSISDFTQGTKNLIIHNKNTLPGMMLLEKLGL